MSTMLREVIPPALYRCAIELRTALSRLSLAIERMEVVRHDGECAYNHNRPPRRMKVNDRSEY